MKNIQSTLSLLVALWGSLGIAHAKNIKCDLRNYVFQDQKGEEAYVKDIKECFGYLNRDNPSRSSSKNTCLTEASVNKHIKSDGYKSDIRIAGRRIFTILYQGKFYYIFEDAVDGSPWLSYEVVSNLKVSNISNYKNPGKLYKLLDGEPIFDFTENAPAGFDYPENLYKELLGKNFIYKKCQI